MKIKAPGSHVSLFQYDYKNYQSNKIFEQLFENSNLTSTIEYSRQNYYSRIAN